MLSVNELCRGEKPLWQKVRGMSRRVSQPCREGDRAAERELGSRARSCLWEESMCLKQTAALGDRSGHGSPHQLHCSPLFFFPSPFLQFIFLTCSMMLLQTENNRDRVSAKAISELNQS